MDNMSRRPKWSDLQTELLELVFSKLSFLNVLRCKSVCYSWRSAANSYDSSQQYTHPLQTPVLMLPPKQESDENSICLYTLEDRRVYHFSNAAAKELRRSICVVGSSHGWLVLLDQHADPVLLNLFSLVKIQLPTNETFPHIQTFSRKRRRGDDDDDDEFVVAYKNGFSSFPAPQTMSMKDLRGHVLIKKAVLSSSPSCDHNYTVMVIYSQSSKLAFFRHGGGCFWTHLHGNNKSYSDILCCNNQLYALGDEGSIEVWDFNNFSPIKTINIQPSFPSKIPQFQQNFEKGLYSAHWYLVESRGDVMFVIRYVGEFVRDGKLLYEGELLTKEDPQPLVCPYQTLDFHVYRLDFDREKWLDVENLDDRVLFLGGNHSLSVSAQEHPECKKNSIYFTDNYWDQMDEDFCYGGHDMGVFGLEDKRVEMFYHLIHSDMYKVEPPPFWVVPSPL